MTHRTLHPSFRRALLGLCLAFSLTILALPARAENPPRFQNPEVTAYFQKMADAFDGCIRAAKAKDRATYQKYSAQMRELSKQGETMQATLSTSEQDSASTWLDGQMAIIQDAIVAR